MEFSRRYSRTKFDQEALRASVAAFPSGWTVKPFILNVTRGRTTVTLDEIEDWFNEFTIAGRSDSRFYVVGEPPKGGDRISLSCSEYETGSAVVDVVGTDRTNLVTILNVFDQAEDRCRLPEPPQGPAPKPVVFIGHGHSSQWRELKDELQDRHGFRVVAYETGERGGHAVRDVLQQMVDESSVAFLVMTGEDLQGDGTLRARENVVHEVGLFQGALGFRRAVALVEEGIEPFSNLQGIDQLRFGKDNIKEVFGRVLGVLRREFGS